MDAVGSVFKSEWVGQKPSPKPVSKAAMAAISKEKNKGKKDEDEVDPRAEQRQKRKKDKVAKEEAGKKTIFVGNVPGEMTLKVVIAAFFWPPLVKFICHSTGNQSSL